MEDFVDDIFIFETRGDELEEMLHSDNFTEAELVILTDLQRPFQRVVR